MLNPGGRTITYANSSDSAIACCARIGGSNSDARTSLPTHKFKLRRQPTVQFTTLAPL